MPDVSRPMRVLVVAEERRALRHLSKTLGAFGYEVKQAADLAGALAVLEADAVDMLMVDADPKPALALELCRTISTRPQSCSLFTFLLTAPPTPSLLTDALAAGVDDFLGKPLVEEVLMARVRSLLLVRQLYDALHDYFIEMFTRTPQTLSRKITGNARLDLPHSQSVRGRLSRPLGPCR